MLGLLAVTGVYAVVGLGVLKQYQLDRLTTFLDPESGTSQGTGYNLEQSTQAIAHGRTTGEGLLNGSQTQGGFVPEQHTDFIFTSVGEELGFFGGVVLLALFAIVMWRTWRTARLSRDFFGTLVCVGVLAMLGLPDVREHGHDHGDHAGHRHPAAVHELRRLVAHHQLRLPRPGGQRLHAALQLSFPDSAGDNSAGW